MTVQIIITCVFLSSTVLLGLTYLSLIVVGRLAKVDCEDQKDDIRPWFLVSLCMTLGLALILMVMILNATSDLETFHEIKNAYEQGLIPLDDSRVREANLWLAKANASKEAKGCWSFYDKIDLSELKYIS